MTREEAIIQLEEMHSGYLTTLLEEQNEFGREHILLADCEALAMAIEALRQDERPKGRWEFVELQDHPLCGKPLKVGEYRCPFCGRAVAFKPPYCHCGADMRGEEE